MTRRKSTVVLPQSVTLVLRRSARLIPRQDGDGQGISGKDLVFSSEPPSKSRRKLLGVQLNLFGDLIEGSSSKISPGSNSSIDGFPSLRRSLRVSSRESSSAQKEMPFMKPESKSTNVSSSFTLRRSPRFSSGGVSVYQSSSSSNGRKSSGNSVLSRCSTKSISSEIGKGGDGVKSRDRSRIRNCPKTKQMFRGYDDEEKEEEVNVCLSESKRVKISKPNEEENVVPKADKGKSVETEEEEGLKTKNKIEKGWTKEPFMKPRTKSTNVSSSCTLRRSPRFLSGGVSVDQSSSSSNGRKSYGNSVLSRFSTKSSSSVIGKGGDGVKSRDRSRIRNCQKTKQMLRGYDDEEEEDEVNVFLSEGKRVKIAKPNEEENVVPKADKGKSIETEEEEGLKTKNKIEKRWTEELELALQGAYLTVNPSPNFWKKVAKMVPGKSAQECFDRVNSALITPRQLQPLRARKTNLSTIPQFLLSASKLLKPNSPKIKIRQPRSNISKKTVRHLLEKQNLMDQGLGFDLFSVLEPNTSSNLITTPTEKGKSLPKILESPVPCSRFASEDQTTLVSPPVLKQVKNKALHEKYIDHLHIREAKRKAESTRLARKENIKPIDIQKKDSVRAAKDALYFDVQDAIQKLKGLETENSSSSSEFCYDNGKTDEEDESI